MDRWPHRFDDGDPFPEDPIGDEVQFLGGSKLSAIIRRFRKRRMNRFAVAFGITERTRILDVGGMPGNWTLLDVRPRVTLLNLPYAKDWAPEGFEFLFADGCRIPARDRAFDIVFSNSVIEHVGEAQQQQRFADEIRRVGQQYWVQTPNRGFPVEPHLLTPLVHYLPRSWQRWILPKACVWAWIERPSPASRKFYVEHFLNDIRLINARELRQLFPDGEIIRERFGGLTKSLIAYRRR